MNTSYEKNKYKILDSRWAIIKAMLALKGYTLISLAKHLEIDRTLLTGLKRTPCPKYEKIIAEIIGNSPLEIWPGRYDSNGKPNRVNRWYSRGSKKMIADNNKNDGKKR